MELQRAGGHHAGHRTLDGLRHRFRLRLAARDQEQFARIEDRADAHGDGIHRHVFPAVEEPRVVVDRLLGQGLEPRARAQGAGGLVEGDMPIRADAEDLQVDPAAIRDAFLVPLAKGRIVARRP